ncbi:PilZ domain-containing protein [Salinimonas marina]|uniref:PilZ domain-containing protein n=1 Tax=Salinimonas marina TaxID=2785918 RepID=A0A7S9HEP9_9ALTE|nr:PilZ domain-containing protein [Salinimonas marina]QPG06901.1 PilZ domain-containing protein [Salinimonas marina]
MAGEEAKTIKQYQALIRALIPYEQENRLLEGLNRFSGRLPGTVRKTIKDEVIRLTSLTDAPADNSAFAQFPVFKFKHFGIDMRLDKVGANILKTESSLYQNRYTVGVFESLTNSDFYQAQIKKEQYRKIVDAFTIEAQSQNDIQFGDDIAIAPNFPVACPEFDKGRSCTVPALGHNSMVVETKRPPKAQVGELYQFALPEVFPQNKDTGVGYRLDKMVFNKDTDKYESHFCVDDKIDDKTRAQIQKYIESNAYQQPLKRELELERAMQDLERDRIVANSPWVTLQINDKQGTLVPKAALFTKTNQQRNKGFSALAAFSGKHNFAALTEELSTFNEAFLLCGTVETRRGKISINATHRQLLASNLFIPIMYLLTKHGKFQCYHCRWVAADSETRRIAYATHDIAINQHEEFNRCSHLLFFTDISDRIGPLGLPEACQMGPIHQSLQPDTDTWDIQVVIDDTLDRRQEARYEIEKTASIRRGLLRSVNAQVLDVSLKGIRVRLAQPEDGPLQGVLKITVGDLKIKNEKYQVVSYCKKRHIARLKVAEKAPTAFAQLVEENPSYFRPRDAAKMSRNRHRFIWEMAVREHPSASLLCVANRFLLDRIKTLYLHESSQDLYPFSQEDNIAPLHGFFADQGQDKPKSTLLLNLLKAQVMQSTVIHCLRKTDNKLVYVNYDDYRYKAIRQQLIRHLDEEKVELCATRIEVQRCSENASPLIKKRLALLSKVDKALYERLLNMQSAYTHVIYLTNESVLQTAIITGRLRPLASAARTPRASQQQIRGYTVKPKRPRDPYIVTLFY